MFDLGENSGICLCLYFCVMLNVVMAWKIQKSLEDEYVTSQLENSYVSKFQIDDADSLTHSSLICRLSVVRKGSRIKFIFVNLGYPSHVSSL